MNDLLTKPFIPKYDTGYEEIVEIKLDESESKYISLKVPPKPSLKHELAMWDAINTVEKEAWSPKSKGFKTGWKSIDNAFDGGIKPGFIIIGADSNVGKTILLTQMLWQISVLNDNVFVADFSLDDPLDDKMARVIACSSKVLINAVKNPNNYKQYPLMLARRAEGFNNLRKQVEKYRVYDSLTLSTNIEDIEDEINKIRIELDANGKQDVEIVVGIDNFHDLTSRDHPRLQKQDKFDYLAQYCADMAIRQKCLLLCTGELRKVNGLLRPTIDSIRETVKIKYEAKAILLCHNDVHYRGEGAEVFFKRSDSKLKQPVLEVHFAKNKMSSFKGRIFFESYPEISRMEEADEQSAKHYASVVFGG